MARLVVYGTVRTLVFPLVGATLPMGTVAPSPAATPSPEASPPLVDTSTPASARARGPAARRDSFCPPSADLTGQLRRASRHARGRCGPDGPAVRRLGCEAAADASVHYFEAICSARWRLSRTTL